MHNEVSSKTGSRLAELGNLDKQNDGAQAEWQTGDHSALPTSDNQRGHHG